MMIRRISLRAPLAAAALAGCTLAPAVHAQDVDHAQSGADRLSEKLSDPATQLAVTAALVAMSEALMQIRVEPFARAAEAAGAKRAVRDLPPDATVRDLAGPRAGDMQAELARRTPAMMAAASGMAGALSDMMPQLREMAARMKDAIPRSHAP